MNLNALMAAMGAGAAESNKRIEGEIAAIQQDNAQLLELGTLNLADAAAATQAQQQAAQLKIANDTVRNQARDKAQAVAGLDPNDMENQYVQSMAELTATQAERRKVRSEYDKLASVNFFDNPIGYIFAQMDLPSISAQHNALAAKEDAAVENVAVRTRMLTQYTSAVTANTAGELAKQAQAAAQADAIAANIKLREAAMQLVGQQSAARARLIQLEDKRFDNLRQALGTQMQFAQYQMSLEERREAREQRRRDMEAKLADKKAKDEAVSRLDANVALISGMLGQIGPDGKPLVNSLEMIKAMPKKDVQDAWWQRAQTADLGDGLDESLNFFDKYANRQTLNQQNRGMVMAADGLKIGMQAYEDAVRRPDPKNPMAKPPAAKDVPKIAAASYQNDLVSSASDPKAVRSLTDPHYDKVFNPYRAQHAVLLDQINADPKLATLKDNVMVKALTTVMSALPPGTERLTGEDEQRAIKVAVQTAAKQRLPIREIGKQISQYYAVAARKNLEFYNYDQFDLPLQTRYQAAIKTDGMFSDVLKADLINQAEAERLAARLLTPSFSRLPRIQQEALLGNNSPR